MKKHYFPEGFGDNIGMTVKMKHDQNADKKLIMNLKELSTRLKKTGFYSVFLSSIFTKILTFLGGILLVRLMSKNDYGLYAYIMNSYSILFILSDFGCCQAMLQYRSENYDDKKRNNDYYTFAYRSGIFFSGISGMMLFMSPIFYPFKYDGAARLTQALCLMPFITTTNSFLLSNLRVQTRNTRYALINIIQTIIHYGVIVPLSFFWNVWGAVISNYAIGMLTLVASLIISHRCIGFDWKSDTLTKNEKKDFVKFAIASQLNNSVDALFQLVDIFFIGLFVAGTDAISSYKIATNIPSALTFIPNSIIIYVLPYFARHFNDIEWVRNKYRKLLISCMVMNGGIAACIALSSPWLVPLIYGMQYIDAVYCSIILIIAFFFSGSLYVPSANIIYTQHKVKVNIAITIVVNIINCILDIVLIDKFGSIGAAAATLIVSIASGCLSMGYMIYWMRKNGSSGNKSIP